MTTPERHHLPRQTSTPGASPVVPIGAMVKSTMFRFRKGLLLKDLTRFVPRKLVDQLNCANELQITIEVLSGSSGDEFLSPNFVFDCVELFQ
ncbi:hypothetical protein AWENTII_002444 [Aspergillus wentii]